jgi:hypothetical protein
MPTLTCLCPAPPTYMADPHRTGRSKPGRQEQYHTPNRTDCRPTYPSNPLICLRVTHP